MSNLSLNQDIFFLIFEELQDDLKSLSKCLTLNKTCCKMVISILWRNPWRYDIGYFKNHSLCSIITSYLTDKEYLISKGIQPLQLRSFDYLSFCKSINVDVIGSILGYDHLLEQRFYDYYFMKNCSRFESLNMKSIRHQIFKPEFNNRLKSLYELSCDTFTESSYFDKLKNICQDIKRLFILNEKPGCNDGIADLIKIQKSLKYFKWDDFSDGNINNYYSKIGKTIPVIYDYHLYRH